VSCAVASSVAPAASLTLRPVVQRVVLVQQARQEHYM
jgi:hypothetical protein